MRSNLLLIGTLVLALQVDAPGNGVKTERYARAPHVRSSC